MNTMTEAIFLGKSKKSTIQHNNGHPITVPDIPRRNSKCPCNSGKKFKICCLPKLKDGYEKFLEPNLEGIPENGRVPNIV